MAHFHCKDPLWFKTNELFYPAEFLGWQSIGTAVIDVWMVGGGSTTRMVVSAEQIAQRIVGREFP